MPMGKIDSRYEAMQVTTFQDDAPKSATKQQITEMREGERWSHEEFSRTYTSGGNEGPAPETAKHDQK